MIPTDISTRGVANNIAFRCRRILVDGSKRILRSVHTQILFLPHGQFIQLHPFLDWPLPLGWNSQDPISGEELLVADLSYEVRLLSVEERYNLKSENELAGEVEDHL